MRLLPGPDVPDDEIEDWGLVEPDEPDEDIPPPVRVRETVPVQAPEAEPDELLDADPEPAHLKAERSGKRQRQPGGRTTRVTAAVQKDVLSKIRFVTMPAGQMWAVRDPLCGGTLTEQEPQIAAALSEIVCDSPDLLAWFTGPTGKYMKFFNLFMACLPVGVTVYGHHLAHRPEREPFQAPDYSQYAA